MCPRAQSEVLTKAEERRLPSLNPDLNTRFTSTPLPAGGRQRRWDRNSEKGQWPRVVLNSPLGSSDLGTCQHRGSSLAASVRAGLRAEARGVRSTHTKVGSPGREAGFLAPECDSKKGRVDEARSVTDPPWTHQVLCLNVAR